MAKIYAKASRVVVWLEETTAILLGMSSDEYIPAGLFPDYEISWKDLFYRLGKSLAGEQASVEAGEEEEIAVIKSKGCVLGWVSKVEHKRR
jgi:hypothetical protein